MLFSDLLNMPLDANTGRIAVEALTARLPDVPSDVMEQVFLDHGRNDDFQELYGRLNIADLEWRIENVPADTILNCSMNEDFRRWFQSVGERVARFKNESWLCVDSRSVVRDRWQARQTWLRAPVFLAGEVIRGAQALHLMEGHTRVGLLAGLVQEGIVERSSAHAIWIGYTRTP